MTTSDLAPIMDTRDLWLQVDESRARILAADPQAHRGAVTDAAIRAVSLRSGVHWRYVLRAWRAKHPRKRPVAVGALASLASYRPVSDDAKRAA
jgi:hypothetical protein